MEVGEGEEEGGGGETRGIRFLMKSYKAKSPNDPFALSAPSLPTSSFLTSLCLFVSLFPSRPSGYVPGTLRIKCALALRKSNSKREAK